MKTPWTRPRATRGCLWLAALLLTGWAAYAAPVITSVVETGGDNEATDTITAKWTGVTWATTIANEPTPNTPVGTQYTVPVFNHLAPTFVDRNHRYINASASVPVPGYLAGKEYIMSGNDNRDNAGYILDITISSESYVYMLVDNRMSDGSNANPPTFDATHMQWLVDGGWVAMSTGANRSGNASLPDEVGIDEGADDAVNPNQWYSVYVKKIPAGTFQIFQADNAGQNMYGVVIAEVPKVPYVSSKRGDMRGVTFTITDGSLTSLNPNSIVLTLDGVTVTPQRVEKVDLVTTVAYRVAYPLVSGSSHTSVITFADSTPTTYTDTLNFTVPTYPTIPPAMSLPSVDTAKPGFKARVYQYDNTPADGSQNIVRGPGGTGLLPNVERQLALGYINPATSQPYANTSSSTWTHVDTTTETRGADGYFLIPGVINWSSTAPTDSGNFTATSVPPFPDDTVPGMPGSSITPADRFVFSIETILELKRGAYRFGVNSDDGFRLSAGWGSGAVIGIEFGTAGERGASDTLMDFAVEADGLYPIRLMYFESTGGDSCEFFFADAETGVKTLINDLTAATPIKAYRDSVASRPYLSRVLPANGEQFVHADRDLLVEITDGAIAVDLASVSLTLNGTPVTELPVRSGNLTTIHRTGSLANLFASGANNLVLAYSFTSGGTPTWVTNAWSFTVPPYTTIIPAAYKAAPGTVDPSYPGFLGRLHQIDRSQDANQGNGGRYSGNGGSGNAMPRPEIQFARGYINRTNDLPFDNLSVPGYYDTEGTHDISDIINWNTGTGGAAAQSGIFQGTATAWPDNPVPGLPGTGTSGSTAIGLDNTVMEIVTYLELKAGAHLFGVNCDDGFVVSCGANPRDTLGVFLAQRSPGGGNSGSLIAAAVFNVIVPEDGLYPFRLLWWQGGGGINLEFLTVDRLTGQHLLVNDVGNSLRAVKAYKLYNGPARPWTKFSVYPMPLKHENQHQQSGPGPILVRLGAGNPADIANDAPGIRPFGDAIGGVVADLGSESVGMVLNGVPVTPTVTTIAGTTDKLVLYTPDPPLPSGSTNTAGLVYAGGTNSWTFAVITNVVVPDGVVAPASAADQNAKGFRVKVAQAVSARLGGNTAAAAEAQLAGNPASVAIPGPESDGSYILPGIINLNVTKNPGNTASDTGNFQPLLGGPADEAFPGIPGTGLTGNAQFENFSAEFFAWLDLPKGYQKFGVGADDGFKLQVGRFGQTTGPVLFTIDRGAGNRDFPIAFITPEAGLYPIRLVYYQGTGGGNVEFFTYGANNAKIAVNDPNNPAAVKAYYNANVGPTEPPAISYTVNGNQIIITWTNGGTLEWAPTVSGGWTSTLDSDGSFTDAIAPTGARFYRVKR